MHDESGRASHPAPRSARQGDRPRRIYAQPAPARHALRQDLPQHGAARPHPQHRYAARRARLEGVHRVVTGEDIRKLIPEPYYGPAFHDQPILALDKVRHVGEPVAVVLASDPHVAEQAVQTDRRRIRRTAGGLRRGRGDAAGHHRARRAQARRHFRRSQASQGPHAAPTSRSIIICGAATSTAPSRAPTTCSSTRSARSSACTCRSSRSCRVAEPGDGTLTIHTVEPDAVVRAHRDRAAARLAGEPRAGEGAVSRRRVRRQGLRQARSAGRRARAASCAGRSRSR